MQSKQKNWAVISCCIALLGVGATGGVSAQDAGMFGARSATEKPPRDIAALQCSLSGNCTSASLTADHMPDTDGSKGIPPKGLPFPPTNTPLPPPEKDQSYHQPGTDRRSESAAPPAPVPNTANGGAQGVANSSKPVAGKTVVRNPQAAQVYKGRFGGKLSTLQPKAAAAQTGGKLAMPMLPEIIPPASTTPKAGVAQAAPAAAASAEKQATAEAKKTTSPTPNSKPAAEAVVVQKVIVDGKPLVAVDAKGSGLLMVARPEKEFEKATGASAQAVSTAGAQTVNMPSAAVRSLGASGPSNVGRVQIQESPSSLRQSLPRPNVQFD